MAGGGGGFTNMDSCSSDDSLRSESSVSSGSVVERHRGLKRRRQQEQSAAGGRTRRETWSHELDTSDSDASISASGRRAPSASTGAITMPWVSGHFHDGLSFSAGANDAGLAPSPRGSAETTAEAKSEPVHGNSGSGRGGGGGGGASALSAHAPAHSESNDRWAWLDEILPGESSGASSSGGSTPSSLATSTASSPCNKGSSGTGRRTPVEGGGGGAACRGARHEHLHEHQLSPAGSSSTGSECSLPPLVPELNPSDFSIGAPSDSDASVPPKTTGSGRERRSLVDEDPMMTWEEQQFAKMQRKHSSGSIIIDQSNAMSRYIQPVFKQPGATDDQWGWYVEEPENSPPKDSLWRPLAGHNQF